MFINIAIGFLEYMSTCFDPNLGHIQAHITYKINFN